MTDEKQLFITIIGSIIVGLIGYLIGNEKAFWIRLQAQLALCQMKIEENTVSLCWWMNTLIDQNKTNQQHINTKYIPENTKYHTTQLNSFSEYCPKCNSELLPHAMFCGNCSHQLFMTNFT